MTKPQPEMVHMSVLLAAAYDVSKLFLDVDRQTAETGDPVARDLFLQDVGETALAFAKLILPRHDRPNAPAVDPAADAKPVKTKSHKQPKR